MSETVMKGGEEWLKLSLSPSKRGMLIEVRTHPLIEEFMQAMSGGRTQDFSEIAKFGTWITADDTKAMATYRSDLPFRPVDRPATFNISNVGGNIVEEDQSINLAFLRIVGISDGVRFISSKEVYPLHFRRELKVKIGNAFRDFIHEYIRPVRITLVMTSQEF